jgi:hypothetical protein
MSLESQAEPLSYSDWVALLGFLEEDEALKTIQGQGVNLVTPINEWLDQIRNARETVSKITGRLDIEPPRIIDVDNKYKNRIFELQNEPTFKEHLAGMKYSRFALIEISKLHSFIPFLNLEYINSMKDVPPPDDISSTIKFCLPTQKETKKSPILTSLDPNINTFTATAQNLDFRITGNVQGHRKHEARFNTIIPLFYFLELIIWFYLKIQIL